MSSLILVSLPIGNIGDLTARAKTFLQEHQSFLAEDTRHFCALLKHLKIDTKKKSIDSFHDDSKGKIVKIMGRLRKGEHLAIVSDAGSPILSDPAFPLVKKAIDEGYPVKGLPGVNSVITALELSGLPPHPFSFHGFLPRRENLIRRFFQTNIQGTHIVFESARRIQKSLEILCQELPHANICVARELTKKFEEIIRFKANQTDTIESITPKGETVLLYHIEQEPLTIDPALTAYAQKVLAKNSTKNVARLLGKILNQDTNEIYHQLMDSHQTH